MSKLIADKARSPAVRAAALEAMAATHDAKLADAVGRALIDESASVRAAAIRLQASLPDALPRLAALLDNGSISDKQAVFAALPHIAPNETVDDLLCLWLDRLNFGSVAPEVQLDLLEAAAAPKDSRVAEKVKIYQASRPKDDARPSILRSVRCLRGRVPLL